LEEALKGYLPAADLPEDDLPEGDLPEDDFPQGDLPEGDLPAIWTKFHLVKAKNCVSIGV
jgi:hypothetical protein